MPASMFDDVLPARESRASRDFRLGPCAMGPVAEGDTLTWMRVWILQHDGSKVAAATGTSGERVDGKDQRPPYKGRWMIRTELERRSDAFTAAPATAVAMAFVTRADGTRDVEQWTQEVSIVTDGEHGHGGHREG